MELVWWVCVSVMISMLVLGWTQEQQHVCIVMRSSLVIKTCLVKNMERFESADYGAVITFIL